jgi:hypothetical protein
VPLFILAGGELVLLFLGARIAWWVLRTRADRAPAAAERGPTGGGVSSCVLHPTARTRANVAAESLRKAA